MATETDICNLALTRIGASRITDIADANPSARNCKQIYATCRDTVLRAHDWNFARKRVALAEVSETFEGWTYAYAYPADCIKVIKIYNSAASANYIDGAVIDGFYVPAVAQIKADEILYEVAVNTAVNKRRILTNQENAVLIYTAQAENPTVYDGQFVDAFAWLLAADLCMPLKGDPAMSQNAMQRYAFSLSQAEAQDAREEYTVEPGTSSYEAARM